MATDVCSSASPRISFSQGILSSSAAAAAGEPPRADGSLPLEPLSADFNFSIGFQISADQSSNADELFSDGKILPFFKTPKNPAETRPIPPPILERRGSLRDLIDSSAGSAADLRAGGRRSFWRFGRSSSVGSVAERGPIFPFSLDRSKSTGSFPNPASRPPQIAGNVVGRLRIRSDSNRRKTYYFPGSQRGSHAGGVRINPILNVPAPIVATGGGGSGGSSGAVAGIFAYLLCNCGGEGKGDRIGNVFGASQQNGTGSVDQVSTRCG